MQCLELGTWSHDSRSFLLKYQMTARKTPAAENRLAAVFFNNELLVFFFPSKLSPDGKMTECTVPEQ